MPVAVANVVVESDNFQSWIDRTNEALSALRTLVVTTNGNTAVGNAVVNGAIQTSNLHVSGNVYGGTIGSGANLTIASPTVFLANVDINGDRLWIGGNKVWHAGNDGAGTGLDADTVDGLQASVFARSDVTATFANNVTVLGNLSANAPVAFANTLGVTGAASFSNTVSVTGSMMTIATANVATLYVNGTQFNPAVISATTAANGTSNTLVATTQFVQNAITLVKDGVSSSFDTLAKLATAIGTKLTASSNLSDVANSAIAFDNIKQAGNTSYTGVWESATDAETQTGTSTTLVLTPSNLTAKEANTTHYLTNTADRILTTDIVWATGSEAAISHAANQVFDMSTFFNASVTLTSNTYLANPTNAKPTQTGRIRFIQDATGSRRFSGFGANWKFAGDIAPVLSTSGNAVDILYYDVVNSSYIVANLIKDVR